MEDKTKYRIDEQIVLSKYDGDPLPENEFERMHVDNGQLVKIEKIENGEVVETINVGGGQ